MARQTTKKTTKAKREIDLEQPEISDTEPNPSQIDDPVVLQDSAYANQQKIFELQRARKVAFEKSDEVTAQKYTDRIKERQRYATRFIQRREELKRQQQEAIAEERRRSGLLSEDELVNQIRQTRTTLIRLQEQVDLLRRKSSRADGSFVQTQYLLAYQRSIDAAIEVLSRAPGVGTG